MSEPENQTGKYIYSQVTLARTIHGHEINSFNREHVTICADEPDIDGASHIYNISVQDGETLKSAGYIKFQRGGVQDVGFNGLTDESLLAIVLDRLRGFQRGPFSSRENAIVVTKLEESIMWLRARAEDRERRGVEGTRQK